MITDRQITATPTGQDKVLRNTSSGRTVPLGCWPEQPLPSSLCHSGSHSVFTKYKGNAM